MAEVRPDFLVVGMAGLLRNYPEMIAQALHEQGFRCECYTIPFLPAGSFTPSLLRKLKAELRKASPGTTTIYCSGLSEYYLADADISIHFSAYRRWFNPQRMRIIAHPWTSAEPASIDDLQWLDKPPLTVGFMGSAYGNSRLGQLAGKSAFKNWILSGHHLRAPAVLAALNAARVPFKGAMTFPRAETLRLLESYSAESPMSVRIVDTGGFTGSLEQVAQYEQHMRGLTYVLCPRGIENFSFRFYEALKFGRVPVLIDTEMVLPDEVNWDELIVRVPYPELSNIGDIIAHDYRRHSAASFRRRQEKAFEAMAKLCSGAWATGLVRDVRLRQLEKHQLSSECPRRHSRAAA